MILSLDLKRIDLTHQTSSSKRSETKSLPNLGAILTTQTYLGFHTLCGKRKMRLSCQNRVLNVAL